MVKLRLKRMGSKFNAFYRIVAADARAPRDGRFIEEIGYYNPHSKEVFINEELKTKWENEGAVPSETVKGLFRKFAAAKAKGKTKDGKLTLEVKVKAPKKVAAPVVEEAPKAEAPATEE